MVPEPDARRGVADQYRYLEFIETQEVLENVERLTELVKFYGLDRFR